MVPIISTDELKELIDIKGDYILIDVREPHELRHGTIPTSTNIPPKELVESLKRLKLNDNIIFYCRTG